MPKTPSPIQCFPAPVTRVRRKTRSPVLVRHMESLETLESLDGKGARWLPPLSSVSMCCRGLGSRTLACSETRVRRNTGNGANVMDDTRTIVARPLSEIEPEPETAEEAYRWGYHDGWVQAIDALHDQMFQHGRSRQAAYDVAWSFWVELFDWMREAWDQEPPQFKEPPRLL